MALDIVDLRSFYASALGRVTRRLIGRILRERWGACVGQAILGVGYATPYLNVFRGEAIRTLAFMPAEQGVVNWPEEGVTSSALVDTTMLPLPDSCMDRVLVIHALELSETPRDLFAEIWRILTPGGRVVIVTPNRRGVWAQLESTPFGQGQPYSRGQLQALLRECLFSPVHEAHALYGPPFARPFFLRFAGAIERLGARLALPGAGVHVIEATKQLYRPIPLRHGARRALARIKPALAPRAPGADRSGGTNEDHRSLAGGAARVGAARRGAGPKRRPLLQGPHDHARDRVLARRQLRSVRAPPRPPHRRAHSRRPGGRAAIDAGRRQLHGGELSRPRRAQGRDDDRHRVADVGDRGGVENAGRANTRRRRSTGSGARLPTSN